MMFLLFFMHLVKFMSHGGVRSMPMFRLIVFGAIYCNTYL